MRPILAALIRRLLLTLWMLACAALPLAASPGEDGGALRLDDRPVDAFRAAPHVRVLRDPSGYLDLAQAREAVRAGRFEPRAGVISDGYTGDAYWLHLRVRPAAAAPSRWWLRLERGYLDDVRLHLVPPSGEPEPERRAGDRVVPAGALPLRVPAFEVTLEPGRESELFLRVRTGSAMMLPLALSPAARGEAAVPREYFVLGLFNGVSLILVAASLFGLWRLRDRLYLWYALFVVANALLWFAISGAMHLLVADLQPPWADLAIAACVPMSGGLGLLMYGHLLRVPDHEPALWRAMRGLVGVFLAASLAPLAGAGNHLTPWVMGLLVVVQILSLGPIRRAWRDPALTMRLSALLLLAGGLLTTANSLLALGWIGMSAIADLTGPTAHLVHLLVLLVIMSMHATQMERQRQQAEAQAAQAMQQHARERAAREDQRHLISMIAHEIRTPVSIIDASLQSLRVLDEQITPERQRRHDRIARALDRMNGLVELALTRDRLDVSCWTQELTRVDPAAVTRDAIHILGSAAAERVAVRLADGTPGVEADERMVRFGLLNLIDNALKYSPKGSRVDVAIRPMRHQGREGSLWTILDQGPGVPAADSERIFEKYFRSTDTSDAPGLGLGLYLVRQIFERHGGTVRLVPTAPGNGACFEGWLPAHPDDRDGAGRAIHHASP